MLICIVCKKETVGTLGPRHTRVPVCPDCTPDRRQRRPQSKTNFKDPHRICPDCGGRKGWDSKRCNECNIKRVKKVDPATKICPRCQGQKEPKAKTCLNCYNAIRGEKALVKEWHDNNLRGQPAPEPQAPQEKTP